MKNTSNLRNDFAVYNLDGNFPTTNRISFFFRVLTLPRLQTVTLFRLAQKLPFPLNYVLKNLNYFLTGCDIATTAQVGGGLQLFHPSGVVFGPFITLGMNARVMQGVTIGHGKGGSPIIGDDVFIGSHAVIVGSIHIGDRVHIGANSVVTQDVPSDSLVRNPRPRITPKGE